MEVWAGFPHRGNLCLANWQAVLEAASSIASFLLVFRSPEERSLHSPLPRVFEVSVMAFVALVDRLCKSGHDDMDRVALVFAYSTSSAVEHSTDRNCCCWLALFQRGYLQYHRESETAPPEWCHYPGRMQPGGIEQTWVAAEDRQ